MSTLVELGLEVDWPDSTRATSVQDALVAVPGLGRLADVASWLAGVLPAGSRLTAVRAVLVGAVPGDLLVDAAIAADIGLTSLTPAADVAAAVRQGIELADSLVDGGADLVVLALPDLALPDLTGPDLAGPDLAGPDLALPDVDDHGGADDTDGISTAVGMPVDAAVAVAVLTGSEPVKVLSRGSSACDPEAWMRRASRVRDERRRCHPHRSDADRLLAELGSTRLAVAAALALRCAVRRTPVLLDGPTAVAAALIAYEAQPRAVRWWIAADDGDDPLQTIALTRLGQRGVLGLRTSTGDGVAGALAVPVLRVAAGLADGSGDDDLDDLDGYDVRPEDPDTDDPASRDDEPGPDDHGAIAH